MTSYEFEKVAKNAVIKLLKEQFGLKGIKLSEMNFTWFSYQLGGMKCLLYSPKMFDLYAEVTYNKVKDELYVDIYKKELNALVPASNFNFNGEEKDD